MFGLFRSKERTQQAYVELLGYMTQEWRMKERYARTFLDAYRNNVAKIHKEATGRFKAMADSGPEGHLLSIAHGGTEHAMALVAQAYQGYMGDLRRGKHVDTDVELVIWAILSNRSDLVESFDKAFGNYIYEKHEDKFPRLFDEVFEKDY
jgi:hypothetical protein